MLDPFATSPPTISVSGTQASPASATVYTPASIVLTPGVWLVQMVGLLTFSTTPTVQYLRFGLGSANANISDSYTVFTTAASAAVTYGAGLAPQAGANAIYSVPLGTTKTVYAGARYDGSGGTVLAFNVTMSATYYGNG